MKSDKLPFIVFLLAAAVLCFLAGVSVAVMKWPPYEAVKTTKDTAEELIRGPWMRDKRFVPRRYEGQGVTVNDARAFPGVTLVQGHFQDGAEIRTYAMDGTLLQSWPMVFSEVWPDPTHIIPAKNVPNSKFHYHTQGIAMEPDGSIVVNFAEKGTAKFSACGEVEWTVDRMTHHSITRNADGSYWIPAKIDPADIPPEQMLPGVNVRKIMASDNFYADVALLVSPDGEILKEIPVLGPVLDWYADRQAFDRLYEMKEDLTDPLHMNDIEVVTEALAAQMDGVKAGDLILSLRNTHALAILDPDAGVVRAMIHGPWIRQHDPDITPEGRIEVYDNGITQKVPGRDFSGTRIIQWDPATQTPSTIYPQTEDQTFFSWIMGTHQALPNGNRLITETTGGRVFEITPDGELVWELVEISTDSSAALIEEGKRFAEGYVDPAVWSCSGGAG